MILSITAVQATSTAHRDFDRAASAWREMIPLAVPLPIRAAVLRDLMVLGRR
jgi:hypothetical protein